MENMNNFEITVITEETLFTKDISRTLVNDTIEAFKNVQSTADNTLEALCLRYGINTIREGWHEVIRYECNRDQLIGSHDIETYISWIGSYQHLFEEVLSRLEVDHPYRACVQLFENEAKQLLKGSPATNYKVELAFDEWDWRERQDERPHPGNPSWNSPWNDDTHGTIFIDGVTRSWWLRVCQDIHGQVICIDCDDSDKDEWNLNWVWRADYVAIKYAIIAALTDRNAPESTETAERLKQITAQLTGGNGPTQGGPDTRS